MLTGRGPFDADVLVNCFSEDSENCKGRKKVSIKSGENNNFRDETS